MVAQTSGNLFGAIATSSPVSTFFRKASTVAVPSGVATTSPIQTNNFWGNLTLGDQTSYVYTHPYAVWMSTLSKFKGLAVSDQDASQRVFGSDNSEKAASYFYMPAGNKCVVLGSSDFEKGMSIKMANLAKLSAEVKLQSAKAGYLSCHLVQGMGFISGVYYDLIPEVHSGIGIKSVSGATSPRTGTNKYTIVLNDGRVWSMYVNFTDNQTCSFALKDNYHIIGSNSINNCSIQLARDKFSSYDSAAGCFPTAVTLKASVSGSTGTYSFNYTTQGSSNKGTSLIYALPHQIESFTSSTSSKKTAATLLDTVHGEMTGYLTNVFEMSESLPTSIGIDPWSSISGWSKPSYTTDEMSKIKAAALIDAAADVYTASNSDSMYFSGKVLDKYAYVLYVLYYVVKDESASKAFLKKMKTAIERFSNNKQTYPLCYETNWKGICSTGGMADGDTSLDYGNAFYNDHHFHYGYHIHAAALTAVVDKALGGSWYKDIKDWVNTMVRDVANPNESDTYFPVFRSFDWFIGHSFAHGITVYADGKDEESSSEDYNFSYAMKIWAQVIGDTNMEDRANLMLAISKRSIGTYMLYNQSNTVMPSKFIGNFVSGIKFENKIDHTTYFGTNVEYIHGIHMLPITPVSSFIRTPEFVKEEWETGPLANLVGSVDSGWKGILYLNSALYKPTLAYQFFISGFQDKWLDDGLTKTWALAYSAGVRQ
ncbi:hypothetical protein FOA43_002192 [Brettanomyces nanus]|uniref:glucan endo-1,3-beta-D-glucosidase n=1 Tax=Eeniella nana TaxID=13502 RepID=A0A875S0C3_EENNA|nr:uncharacterized protein FOA43_002192 [Brettanomyces nanus]QPG74856.1 hypothetical protein FOA43_002192 [Brettanomyces nanus]